MGIPFCEFPDLVDNRIRMNNKLLVRFLLTGVLAIGFFLNSLVIKVSPVLAVECMPGQETLDSGCECSAPRGAPYHQTNNRDSANPQRFCVDRCAAGANVFNASGVPTCFCASDANLIIDTNGVCVSESPDCTTGAPIENCSCYLPRRSVQRIGATASYCVEVCADLQRTEDSSGNPACSCDFRNVSGYCVRDCSNNQLAFNDAGAPLCFCPGSTDGDRRCVTQPPGGAGGDGEGPGINDGITSADFDAFNPLKIANSPQAGQLSTPGGIISRLLEFAFPLAGMILFVMLLWGGFEMVYGASNTSKAVEAGRNRITTALIGFILLFSSYWIIQILEVVLGIKVF